MCVGYNLILVAPVSHDSGRATVPPSGTPDYSGTRLCIAVHSDARAFRRLLRTRSALARPDAGSLYHAAPQGFAARGRSHRVAQAAALERPEDRRRWLLHGFSEEDVNAITKEFDGTKGQSTNMA